MQDPVQAISTKPRKNMAGQTYIDNLRTGLRRTASQNNFILEHILANITLLHYCIQIVDELFI